MFDKLIELPSLADTGLAAMAENKPRAVAAIARALKRKEEEASQWAKVEEVWGKQ